jgi:hypothetical protein
VAGGNKSGSLKSKKRKEQQVLAAARAHARKSSRRTFNREGSRD